MTKGYVYILTNPSMPGLVKIGKTTRSVSQRCHELWQTGVPTPFKVFSEIYSPDCHALERTLHAEFAEDRVSQSREFFVTDPYHANDSLERELREQVAMLAGEFLPGHNLVEDEMTVETADIYRLSNQLDVHPFEIVSAMEFLSPAELEPALNRWRERVRVRAEARKRGEEMPEFRNMDGATIQ